MLRLTRTENHPTEIILKVEGQIVAEWVSLLEQECREVLGLERRLVLDLSDVSYLDGRAIRFLRELIKGPVGLVNCPVLVEELLTEDIGIDPARAQEEFEALFRPLVSMAYGTAVRLTRDRTEAEDLVQDAALLAFRAFGSFQPGTNFKAWFFRILTNAFYSRRRKTKHDRANVSTEDLPALYLYAKTAEMGLHSQEPDPASAMMDRFDTEQVGEALDALPDEYRVVASLYFIEDFSYQQIAEVVGCPVGTVRSRLHRGRRMLQKALWRVAQERGIVPAASAAE